jgi:hypothetical protein
MALLLRRLASHFKLSTQRDVQDKKVINPLNAELNPICHLLALLGAHHILHISRIRVKKDILLLFRPYTGIMYDCLM